VAKVRNGRWWLGVGVSAVAIGAAISHLIWPNAKIDTITVLFVVVALLPWLGSLLESIELPGGWKVKYRSLEERIEQTEQTSTETKAQATEAASTAHAAIGAAGASSTAWSPATIDTVRQLTKECARLRALPPTQARTEEMDRLFGVMAAVVPSVPNFDPAAALHADDPDMRLAGCAYLYSVPDPALIQDVVDMLVHEQSAFNQYWAIMTARALIARVAPDGISSSTVDKLREHMNRLPVGSARRAQLAPLLDALPEP
jgi:hypothetical protein